MARNFINYVTYSYSGGQNDTDEQDQLAENEAKSIKNAYIRNKGANEKRSGSSLTGNDTGDTAITGLKSWREDDGTKWFLSSTGTSLRYLNGTAWVDLDDGFTTGLDTEMVVAGNKAYITNGTDNIHSWDGVATGVNSALTDMGNVNVPKAKYMVFWKNYMFACGDAVLNSASTPNRVYFSDLGAPDTYTHATNYFDVGKSDGQQITGIAPLDKFLVIFKRHSTYVLSGNSPDDWILSASVNNLQAIENSVGCVSHRSIIQVGNDLWFMADDGIRSLRKSEEGSTLLMGIVSGNIQKTIDSINSGSIEKTCAGVFNKRVYFAFPTGTNTYNDTVAVADTAVLLDKPYNPHPWVIYTGWQPSVFTTYTPSTTPQLYFGNASADSRVIQAETGDIDVACVGTLANSGYIDHDYMGPMIDLKQPDMRKTTRFLIASGEAGGDYDVEVSTSVDGTTFEKAGDLNLSAGALWGSAIWGQDVWGSGSEIKQKYPIGRASTQIMVRFRNNQANQPVKMYPYTLAIKPKKVK